MRPRALYRCALALITLAAATIGLAIGWSTGQAGFDSIVLAAVLPVMLTGIAGAAGAFFIRNAGRWSERPGVLRPADFGQIMAPAVIVVSFSTAFILGTFVGAYLEKKGDNAAAREALVAATRLEQSRVARRYEYLVRCTNEFARLNRLREKANHVSSELDLEPLTIGQVCMGLVPPTSPERPLIAVVDDGGSLGLPPVVEKEHHDYLERCSLDQAAEILARESETDTHLTIGHVCPALVASRSIGL